MFECLRLLDYSINKALLFIFFAFRINFKPCRKIALPVRRIICIKLWGLGNLTIIYPLLYRIKEKFPDAAITFVTFDLNKGFLERNKSVDRIVYFKFTRNIFGIIKQFFISLAAVKNERADILINFETMNNVSGIFSYLTNSRVKIGIADTRHNIFYDYPVGLDRTKHISELFLSLLRPLGMDSAYHYHDLEVPAEARGRVEKMLEGLGIEKFVCIHPGTSSNFEGRRYPSRYLSELVNLVIARYDLPVIFTGMGREDRLIENIIADIRLKDRVFNLADKLEKWEFVELVRRSHLIICNDTWVAHIAASLNKNSAIFYGPNSPQRCGPLHANSLIFYKNIPCSPCVGTRCINMRCRNNFACLDFNPQEVFSGISGKFFSGKN